jgi:hypothetical protein
MKTIALAALGLLLASETVTAAPIVGTGQAFLDGAKVDVSFVPGSSTLDLGTVTFGNSAITVDTGLGLEVILNDLGIITITVSPGVPSFEFGNTSVLFSGFIFKFGAGVTITGVDDTDGLAPVGLGGITDDPPEIDVNLEGETIDAAHQVVLNLTGSFTPSGNSTPVAEPASIAMFGLPLVGMLLGRRLRKPSRAVPRGACA